jgi:hypothetical protein
MIRILSMLEAERARCCRLQALGAMWRGVGASSHNAAITIASKGVFKISTIEGTSS